MAIKLPQLPFQLPRVNLGPRTRRVLRYVGLGFFALIVFVFALQMSFPYDRVKDKFVESMAEKYEVTIGGVERGWMPGRVYFKAVSFRSRPTKAEEVVTTFYMEKLEIDLGLFALIGGTISVDFDAKIGAGHLSGTVELEKFGRGSMRASISGDSLPAANLPMRSMLGLPMTGKIQLGVDLALPVEKSKLGRTAINWQKVRGTFTLSCPNSCTFGDGKTKLKPLLKNTRNQAMVGEGIDFGKVNLDSLVAKATIKGGKLTLDRFDAKSKDGELKVDYMMTLEKDFGESMVAGCLRFKGSDDLQRREPKTHAAISTTGAEKRSDGLFHIRLTDRFKDMKRLNQECGPNTNTSNGEDFTSGRPGRPNLTVQPDEAAKPGSGSAMLTAPPPAETIPSAPHDAGPATLPATLGGPAAPATNDAGSGSAEMRDGQRDHREGQRDGQRDGPPAENTGSAPTPPPEGGAN